MKQFRSESGGVRLLALALVAVVGLGIYAVILRGDESRVAVAKTPQKSVLSSYAPAAKVVAQAVPAAPKPTATVSVAPAAQSETRHPARALRQEEPPVRPASEGPAAVVAAPEPPLEGTQGTTRVSTETPPPPPEPLVISDAQVVALSPSTAQITFRTNLPATTRASYGIDSPTIWTAAEPAGTLDHQTVLTGLSFSTTYQVWLHALDEWNQTQTAALTLVTEPMSTRTIATTSGDRILLNDQPFFPLAVWAQCSDGYSQNLADGINLFMGDGCGKTDRQLAAHLGGRAFSIVNSNDADADGRGVIGWYFPDEWDAFLESNVTRADLRKSIPDAQPGRISFLTLTNHFYSHAAPLPQGRGMYPTLYSLADVVGFDLYPLQVWCKPAYGDVFDSQHELSDVTGGKPTFQWIEVAPMEHACADDPRLDPNAATVRAETWLAVAGGADGIGYFPSRWTRDIGDEIARTNRQIEALSPALLAPQVPATTDTPAVRVSARTLNGALYVIAVNTSSETIQTKISVDGVSGRSATVLGDGTVVGSDDKGFTDTFAPLAAKVFVVPPQGW
jgi:hypothetical protein